MVFDAGIKKVPRHSQYFAVKAAQKSIKKREGGIIWHTQGSGKSLIMVWLAKWILENIDDSRVVIVTDRIELDEQIEKVFKGVGERIYRTRSARDLIEQLNLKDENLICSLVHKFGRAEATDKDYDEYIKEMRSNMPSNFEPKGNIFVFVDECHRTQSGKLHRAMKKILPNAVFIGFTGTPLLKKDKPTTLEVFGRYIHTYKFDEGVQDGVILDLMYEARDVDIDVSSEERLDMQFESRTLGLSDVGKAQLKKRWGTLKKLYSSEERMKRIVSDILFDFDTKPRLKTGRGNAMLVAGSIYEACKYYEIFKSKGFDKVAIVTSYRPSINKIKGEETGEEGEKESIKKYEVYQRMIADYFNISKEEAVSDYWIEKFEKDVKKKFVQEPGQMKLLIVVDKLLTGFDAPSATYLYIDKPMQDHGLFQAICRVNRLDDKDKEDELDKEYGYIVDYRDLFKSLERAIKDYTSGAFAEYEREDVEGLLKDRLEHSKKKLDEAIEKVEALIEGVRSPKGINEYREYFIGDDSEEKKRLRVEFYRAVAALVRAYTIIGNEMEEAGYSKEEQEIIKKKVEDYIVIRDELKLMSSDYVDMKLFDPIMRRLIDSYIIAKHSEIIAVFKDRSLLEIITQKGIKDAIDKLPESIGKDKGAVAETIENNVRKLIIDKSEINPAYYEKMSRILKELVKKRRQEVISYEEYLREIERLTKDLVNMEDTSDSYPSSIRDSRAKRAIYDNLEDVDNREELTIKIDEAIRKTRKDDWRGNKIKERQVKIAIKRVLKDEELTEKIFEIVLKQDEY